MLSCRSFLKVLLGSFRLYHMIVIVFLTRADDENKHGIHLPKATAYSMPYLGLALSFLLLCPDSHICRTILLFSVVHRFACASSSGLPESCGWLPRKGNVVHLSGRSIAGNTGLKRHILLFLQTEKMLMAISYHLNDTIVSQ